MKGGRAPAAIFVFISWIFQNLQNWNLFGGGKLCGQTEDADLEM